MQKLLKTIKNLFRRGKTTGQMLDEILRVPDLLIFDVRLSKMEGALAYNCTVSTPGGTYSAEARHPSTLRHVVEAMHRRLVQAK